MDRTERDIFLELLVTRYQRGDRTAWPELIENWERPLYYYIRRFTPIEEDAWDVLQNVWMKVMKGLQKIRDGRALSAWLYKIAHNCALNHLRQSHRLIPLDEENIEWESIHESNDFDLHPADAINLHRAIESLPLLQRETVVLHFLEDFSLDEIARITDTPAGTIKSRLHYAKLALKTILSDDGTPANWKGDRYD